MKHILFFLAIFSFWVVKGQPIVKVELSSDTVHIGEMVEVTYTIENGKGKFELPDFSGLPVVSGPNSSSSFVYQNGAMSSSQSYSINLLPMEEGKISIPGTSYKEGDETISIQPVEIAVLSDRDSVVSPQSESKKSSIRSTREKKKI